MSILDRLLGNTPVTQAAVATAAGSPTALAPVGTHAVSEGELRELDPYAAAAFGIPIEGYADAVTRDVAMRVPAVRRGRQLIAGTIGTLPLTCARRREDGQVEPVRRVLLDQLDPRTTPAYTLTWTVDDLLFYGVSWWRVTDRDATGYPTAVEWLTRDRVTVVPATATQLGRVFVDGREAADRDLIRFDGTDGGLLADGGADTIRLALSLARSSKRVADDDWSGLVLRLVEGATELSSTPGSAGDGTNRSQVEKLLDDWAAARRSRSTGYLNGAVQPHNVGVNAKDRQLTELAQLVSSELARMLNLPPSRIGAPQGSGMTYANTEADRRDLVDTTLALYLTPIAQRLSMGDVTPAGQRVAFDLSAYLRGTVTELVNAGAAAITAQVASPAEVRTNWLGLPARTDVPDTIAAAPAPATREDNPA